VPRFSYCCPLSRSSMVTSIAAPAPDGAAAVAAQIAAAADGLELLECNPVLIHRDGAVVVDAIAKEVVT
jgi:hypothetical protein